MQIRYRWYSIQLPRGTPDLPAVIDDYPFGQETNQGFTRVNGALGHLIHRFLWRSKVVVTQLDENGDPAYQEVETVNFTDFAIINIDDAVFLRIENPGRSIKELLNALESMIGLGFTCKLITFDKKKPTTVFEDIEVIKLIGLKVTGAVLGEDLVARMEFASTEGITPEKLTVLANVPHKTDSASYELIYGGLRGLLSFNSNGTVKVSGQLAPKLIHLVEQDLAEVARLTA
ncbi:hypothetical protein [Chromobacterium violaceum]|uniref:hypothetical protein n=1 Tax=Chromobacterium violaceum TaxID=536 RepID=UPI0015FD895D|nr:hypothetical protein [Chromobacterium violaceum]MBA8735802.1 hypothetical protein [Chromobacterium violaceum]